MKVAILLFEDYETLDVFGPVEILGRLKELFSLKFYSQGGGLVANAHGVSILTEPLGTIDYSPGIFLIPGGTGTRKEVNNIPLLDIIRQQAEASQYVLTVCTGAALLAKTGLLDGKKATSNKRAFDWVVTNGKNVHWIRKARWIVDGKYYTAAGVSAGMDMTLGMLADWLGVEFARQVAIAIEYRWIEISIDDPFG